jgi:hypothetical protein
MNVVMSSTERYLNVSEYARAYGVDRSTVYKFLAAGLLEHYRVKVDDHGLLVVRILNLPPDRHPKTSQHS